MDNLDLLLRLVRAGDVEDDCGFGGMREYQGKASIRGDSIPKSRWGFLQLEEFFLSSTSAFRHKIITIMILTKNAMGVAKIARTNNKEDLTLSNPDKLRILAVLYNNTNEKT